jgi:hypothetical protein
MNLMQIKGCDLLTPVVAPHFDAVGGQAAK